MNNEKLLLLLGGTVLAGGIWYHLRTAVPPSHVLVGIDASISVMHNCAGVRDATRTMVVGKPGFQKGSTLGVLLMGSDAHHSQPLLVFNEEIPIASDLVYGQDPEAFRKIQDAYFAKVESACESAHPGTGSPIYELVSQGLAHLRSEGVGCGPKGRCYFLVKTDGDEDIEPSLRSVLERAANDPSVTVPLQLIKSLDNSGVEVHFCGTAEVRGRRGPSTSPETRARIWAQLFTDPKLVSFEPFCR